MIFTPKIRSKVRMSSHTISYQMRRSSATMKEKNSIKEEITPFVLRDSWNAYVENLKESTNIPGTNK